MRWAVKVDFVGARTVQPVAEDLAPGTVSYFKGPASSGSRASGPIGASSTATSGPASTSPTRATGGASSTNSWSPPARTLRASSSRTAAPTTSRSMRPVGSRCERRSPSSGTRRPTPTRANAGRVSACAAVSVWSPRVTGHSRRASTSALTTDGGPSSSIPRWSSMPASSAAVPRTMRTA
jgi:hypothetical protein